MNKLLFKSLVAISVAYAAHANAGDAISINDTNLGTINNVATFDWTPASALAVGAVPLASSPSSTSFDLYVQASLGNFMDINNQVITGTGLNTDYEITFQAGFSEIGSNFGGVFASFNLDPNATVNFFNIYYDTTRDANALAGTGYGDGQLIMSAVLISNSTFFGVSNPNPVALDQNGANDYPGYYTITGAGGGQLNASVTDLNQDFIFFNNATLDSLIVELAFNTSQILPFQQVDPSGSVVGKAINLSFFDAAYCAANGLAQVATGGCYINGLDNPGTADTADFLFQADANQSFKVPEPASIALLGVGLLAFGASSTRKNRLAI